MIEAEMPQTHQRTSRPPRIPFIRGNLDNDRRLTLQRALAGLGGPLSDTWETAAPNGTLATSSLLRHVSPAAPMTNSQQQDAEESRQPHREVILHYHLFKNAGTSLDLILKQNFTAGWCEHEGPGPGWRAENVTEYLMQNPEIVVLSSHTALLPTPVLPNATVHPIIFVRHPIDRIRSIYEFERKQIAETDGARMAKETDIVGYIRWRLHRKGDRSIRNFQAYRLAFAAPDMRDGSRMTEQERVSVAIETLPFIGVVERFDKSLAKLQQLLKPVFPHIDFKPTNANVTQKAGKSLNDRLADLKDEIGADLYDDIVKTNELDLQIFEEVQRKSDTLG